MSKNVLILEGSPRKGGNSDILCDEFMREPLRAATRSRRYVFPTARWLCARLATTAETTAVSAFSRTICKKYCAR